MASTGPSHHRLRWPLRVDSHDLRQARVLSLHGRLGATGAGALDLALESALSAGSPRILLDLAGVDYVSSAGLAVLARAAARTQEQGGTLVICGLQEPVRVSLEVSGAVTGLAIASDVASACEQLG